MKKILLMILVSLIAISFVFAAQGNAVTTNQGADEEITADVAIGGSAQATQEDLEASLVEPPTISYESETGETVEVETPEDNSVKIKSGDIESSSSLKINKEQVQGQTKLKAQLSNGKNAEIKIMPGTASEKALERLKITVCSADNNCVIQLKETGTGDKTRASYEVQIQRHAKILGIFESKMQVSADVDAETGEVTKIKKPWWAFIASEPEE